MRIALTHPYSWPEVRRGAERIIMETARALAARGHEVTVLTAGSDPGEREQDGFRMLVLQRRHEDVVRHERSFGRRCILPLVRGGFDVVHSFMPHDTIASIQASRITGHLTVYDEMGLPIRPWWADLPDRRARERIVRSVDVYGCMSQYALDLLEEHCGRTGTLIPGGVRLAEFQVAPEREPHPTVLYSGALDVPRKGVDVLLEAIADVASDHADVRLWLSGPGDPEPLLAAAPAAARARTEVLPIGGPNDQARRYGRAWTTALPSINDSFGLVTLESLACGTPIAVTNDSAPREMVRPGIGAISDAGDAASLAVAIRACLALASEPSTAERCREQAAQHDWDDAIAPLLERLYQPS